MSASLDVWWRTRVLQEQLKPGFLEYQRKHPTSIKLADLERVRVRRVHALVVASQPSDSCASTPGAPDAALPTWRALCWPIQVWAQHAQLMRSHTPKAGHRMRRSRNRSTPKELRTPHPKRGEKGGGKGKKTPGVIGPPKAAKETRLSKTEFMCVALALVYCPALYNTWVGAPWQRTA